MADLETLTLRITEESSKAFSAIDKLAKRLDGLSVAVAKLEVGKLNDLASGLTNLNNAIATINASTSKTDYNKIVANLITLSSVDTSRLDGLSGSLINLGNAFQGMSGATSVTASIREMITAIAKLGGVSIQRAITNIPQLETALGNLIRSFSTLPNVNQSVIDFTNALANLASQGQKTGSAAHTISASMESLSVSASRATKRTHSLASTIGTLYAKFWLLLRGARGLKNAFMDAADYLEAYNYFDVTAKKIGKDTFTKAGIGSAEQYAEAFTQTLQEKLHKMSGLELDLEQRLIKTTNAKSLGLNLTELTQYQASIASITNAMGVSQEIAQSTAKAFSMLAGDMGSLKNMDFEQVAQNLQSGLAGMARSLYKFGIDTTTATLQQYAYAEGITKSVSEMTQAEKAQLRLLAILDQSKVSWGDLANTINSPSNQLRMLKNNLKEVGTVMGQLFIPIMQSVLPVLNGLSMAIKQLMVDIAELLGIKLDLESFGALGDELEGDVDATEELNKAMKETKKSIREFDELKVINNSKDRGSGLGEEIDLTKQIIEATAEYEKVWDEAYRRMTSKAQEIAGYISAAFEPIKKIIQDFHVGDFFKAGEDVSKLVISIFDFFSDAISQVNWKEIGKKIGAFLDGIEWIEILKSVGKTVGTALQAVFNLWTGSFSVAPFETAIITAFGLLKFTGLGSALENTLSRELMKSLKKKTGKSNKQIRQAIQDKVDSMVKLASGAISIGLGIAMSIDNIQSVSSGEYNVGELEFWIKSAVASLFTGAGFSLVASAIGIASGGLAFGIGAAISLIVNLLVGKASMETSYESMQKVLDAEYSWVDEHNLDSMEILTNIELKGAITKESLDNIDDLTNKVINLTDNYENLSDEQKGLLKRYSDQLVEAVPGIVDQIDKITGAYIGTKDALWEVINAEKDRLQLESYLNNLKEVQTAKDRAQLDADKLKGQQKYIEDEKQALLDKFINEYGEESGTWKFNKIIEYVKDGWETTDAMANVLWLDYTKFVPDAAKLSAVLAYEDKLNKEFEETDKTLKNLTTEYDYWDKKITDEYTKTQEAATLATENLIDEAEKIVKQHKLPKAVENTMTKVDNQIKHGDTVSSANMNRMFNSINNSFAGLESGKVPADVQATMDAIKRAIEENSPELENLMAQLKIKMVNAYENAKTVSIGELAYNPNGVVTRIDKSFNSIQQALDVNAKPGTKNLEGNIKELFNGNIPKEVNDALKKLATTIDKGEGKQAVLSAVDSLKKELKTTAWEMGMFIALGAEGGIYNGTGYVANATEYMVDEGFEDTFMKKSESNSPSRLARRLGKYLPEGIALGVEDETPKVEYAVSDMVDTFASAFKDLKYNVPKIDFGGSVGSKRYDYGNMDMNNAFMSQMSNMASQMAQSGQTEVVFRVEGDPNGLFKVIREENDRYKNRTHKSAFI